MTPAILALETVSQPYRLLHYSHTGSGLGYGEEAVAELGLDPKKVFKTLLAEDNLDGLYYLSGSINQLILSGEFG